MRKSHDEKCAEKIKEKQNRILLVTQPLDDIQGFLSMDKGKEVIDKIDQQPRESNNEKHKGRLIHKLIKWIKKFSAVHIHLRIKALAISIYHETCHDDNHGCQGGRREKTAGSKHSLSDGHST